MNLYLLKWNVKRCVYDANYGMVIRAPDETTARRLANEHASDEGSVWINEKETSCELLTPNGSVGVIIQDFNAG